MSIVMMRSRLTDTDVRSLVKGLTDEDRAQAAHKICRAIDSSDMTDDERVYAEEIVRIMAHDAATLVRRALAVAMKNSPKLPREVANKLARDIDSVAMPVLMSSPALSDADLIEIIRTCPPNRQVACASRDKISTAVTDAITTFGAAAAVERALANDGATFEEAGLDRALHRFGDREGVTSAMARRPTLPVAIAEKLVSIVSGEVFDHLVNHHALPPQLAIDLAIGARERATVDLIEQAARQSDLARFVQQLNLHGRLTPSLLMRGMCLGQMAFVEHSLAELAGLPHHRVWLMVHDNGPLGLQTLFERCGLPARLLAPFRAGIEVYHEITGDGTDRETCVFRARMIERVLTLFQNVPRDDLDYLLEKLNATGERSSVAMSL
jgi:uncharacterized protein (DUF2336 family)